MASVLRIACIFKQNEGKAGRIASHPDITKRAESLKLTLEFAPGAIFAQVSDVNSRHLAPKCRYFKQNPNKELQTTMNDDELKFKVDEEALTSHGALRCAGIPG